MKMQVCAVLALVGLYVSLVHSQAGNAYFSAMALNPLLYNNDLLSSFTGGMDFNDMVRYQQLQQILGAGRSRPRPATNAANAAAAANMAAAAAVLNRNRNRNVPASTPAVVNTVPNTQTYGTVSTPAIPNYGTGSVLPNILGLGTGGGNNAAANAVMAYGAFGASMNEMFEYQTCVAGTRGNRWMRRMCVDRYLM